MKTIMIVDNEKSILDQVKDSLDENEFDVVTVNSNREAIEIIENDTNDKFGLILIDTSLPDSKQPALFSMKPKSKKDIEREINVRKKILEWMLKKGIHDLPDVEVVIQQYYYNPEALLEKVLSETSE